MKIQISLSGLIKLPATLLHNVQAAVKRKILSYAIHSTEGYDDYEHIFKLFNKYANDNNIALEPIIESMSDVEIDVNVEGLPTSYYKYAKPVDKIVIRLTTIGTNSAAHFSKPNTLTFNTFFIRSIMYSKHPVKYSDVVRYFESLDSTVEHEVSHFIQYNFLHPKNFGIKKRYEQKSEDFDIDDYYTSTVEFDPTIKSEANNFILALKDFYGSYLMDRKQLNARISYYVLASNDNKLAIPGVGQSRFFSALKRKKPTAWKKAIRLFGTLVIKEYINKFGALYENTNQSV